VSPSSRVGSEWGYMKTLSTYETKQLSKKVEAGPHSASLFLLNLSVYS
jgi:hypothetical protein